MEKKTQNQRKANRVLYMVVVIVLCVSAIVVGVVSALSRRGEVVTPDEGSKAPNNSVTEPVTEPKEPESETPSESKEPVMYYAPAVGVIAKTHDLDTLVFSQTMSDYRVHAGIDIATAVGAEVLCAADGIVEKVWNDPMMGMSISVTHEDGMQTIYQNLHTEVVAGIEAGAVVSEGDLIGAVGETALLELADEPHLHFEMKLEGVSVNPLDYINEDSQSVSFMTSEDIVD